MFRTLFLAAAVIAVAACTGWMSCMRHDRSALRGEELVFDDFGFSVKDVRQSKALGPAAQSVRANGNFWIVDLQVANHAKRVGYKLDSHQAVIVDAEDRRIEPSPEGQAALAAEGGASKPVAEIEHGESCITRLVFDVPEGARDPRLKIRFGEIGSALDYVLFGDWRLELR